MKSPHVSPEPPNFLPDDISNVSQNSSSRSSKLTWPGKVTHFMKHKKPSILTQESLAALAAVDDKRYYVPSPYYKGLLNTEPVSGTATIPTSPEPETPITTTTTTSSSNNTTTSSSNNTTTSSSNNTTITATTGISHELQNWSLSSPYYKGLLYTEKVPGTGNLEAVNTASGGSTHDLQSLDPSSPYYRGLLYRATSPDRESQSSSRTSFSVKMSEWSAACFSFRTKDEKDPTMIKVYSTESSNEESLRERVSESSLSPPPPPPAVVVPPSPSPPSSPPLPPPAAKRVVVNAKDTSELKEEKKYLWADRYRPESLKDFICNKDKAIELQHTIINEDDNRHFIFEGQAGVGKRTMIWALLREAYGPDKVQARDECKTFNLKGEEVSSIMVNVKESSQHVEVNLSELKGFEKHVIVELIKETNNLTNKLGRCNNENCRAIILHEADKLSTDALLYIRWVIERYRGCHKVFFCCQDASKLQPLKSICKLVQLLSPSNKEIIEVLEFIAKREEIKLPKKLANRLAINSKNNLRQAIRSLEATSQNNSNLEEDQVILTGWEDDIADIAKSIVEKQSPKQLYDIRRKLQNLIDHSVPPEFIFETLVIQLKEKVDEEMHKQIEKTYKEYSGADKHKGSERHANDERKKLIHQFMSIEEFIAKFMSSYKNFLAKKAVEMTEKKEDTT